MKHLSLRLKLTFSFLVLAVLVGAVNIYQIQSLQAINTQFQSLTQDEFAQREALDDIKVYSLELKAALYQANSQPKAQTLTAITSLSSDLAHIKSKQPTTSQIATSLTGITKKADELTNAALELYQPVSPSPAKTAALRVQISQDQDNLAKLLDNEIAHSQTQLTTEQQQISDSIDRTNRIAILGTALVVCSGILLGIITAARLAHSLNRVQIGAQRIANGNFTELIAATTNDEIGQVAETFNQMSVRLKDSYSRLAVEKQRDETILQNMGEGLIAVDEKAQVVLMNNVAAKLLDLGEATDTIGKTLYPLFALYEQNKRKSAVHKRDNPVYQALSKGKTLTDVYTFKKQDNRSIMINFNANPIILDNKVVGAIVVLRDVTHEREVDRMKTEFISLASHQLRTPLSAIKWFSEMLLSGDAGKLKEEQIDFAKNIADSTERMIELVNSLLNISRIESGRIMVDPKPTDLRELVSGIVTDLKAKTEDRQQNLIVSVHAGLPKINLDPRLIGQVYLNLLTNAIKYTPKGGEISVFISKKDDQVVSQVTDNGYGIPKEQQGRIFQKFFRAENVAKVETDGTGLGLYLIKAIIESSGGKIWFDSEENKGTTFWFSIPMSGMKAKEGEVTLDN